MNPTSLRNDVPVVSVTVPLSAYNMANKNVFGSVVHDPATEVYLGILTAFTDIVSKAINFKPQLTMSTDDHLAESDTLFDQEMFNGQSEVRGPFACIRYYKSVTASGYNIRVYDVDRSDILVAATNYEKKNKNARGFYQANYLSESERRFRKLGDSFGFSGLSFLDAFGLQPYPDTLTDIVDSKVFTIPLNALHSKCFVNLSFPWENVDNIFEVECDRFLRQLGQRKGLAMSESTFGASMPAEIIGNMNPPSDDEAEEEECIFVTKKRKRKSKTGPRKKFKVGARPGLFPFDKSIDAEVMVMRDTNYLREKLNEHIYENEYKNGPIDDYNRRVDAMNDAYWESTRVQSEMSPALRALVAFRTSLVDNKFDYKIRLENPKLSICGNSTVNFHRYVRHGLRFLTQATDFKLLWGACLDIYNTKSKMHFNLFTSGGPGIGKSYMFEIFILTLIDGTWQKSTILASRMSDFTSDVQSYYFTFYPEAPKILWADPSKLSGTEAIQYEGEKEKYTGSQTDYQYFYSEDTEGKASDSVGGVGSRKQGRLTSIIHRATAAAANNPMIKGSPLDDRFYTHELVSSLNSITARDLQFLASIDENTPDKAKINKRINKMTHQTQYIAAKLHFYIGTKCTRVGMNDITFTLISRFLLDHMKKKNVKCEAARDVSRAKIQAESMTIRRVVDELFFVEGAKYHNHDLVKQDITSEMLREMVKRCIIGVEESLSAMNMVSLQWFDTVDRDIILSLRNSIFKVDMVKDRSNPIEKKLTNPDFLLDYHNHLDAESQRNPNYNIHPYAFRVGQDEVRDSVRSKLGRSGPDRKNFPAPHTGDTASGQPLWYNLNYIVVIFNRYNDLIQAIFAGIEHKPQAKSIDKRFKSLLESQIWPESYYVPISELEYNTAVSDHDIGRVTDLFTAKLKPCPKEGIPVARNVSDPTTKGVFKVAFAIEYLERHDGFDILQEIIKHQFPHTGMKERTIPFINHDTQELDIITLMPPAEPKSFVVDNPTTHNDEANAWLKYHLDGMTEVKQENAMTKLVSEWVGIKEIKIDQDLDDIARNIHWGALGLSQDERNELINEQDKLYKLNGVC